MACLKQGSVQCHAWAACTWHLEWRPPQPFVYQKHVLNGKLLFVNVQPLVHYKCLNHSVGLSIKFLSRKLWSVIFYEGQHQSNISDVRVILLKDCHKWPLPVWLPHCHGD